MNRWLWRLGLAAWGAFVFAAVFWLAFPSGVVGRRLSHEVGQATRGQYALELDAVAPWWLGLVADRVILSKRASAGELPEPVFFGERVAAAVSPWQLATRVLVLSGYLRLGGEDLDYEVRAGVKEGKLDPRRVRFEGTGLPLGEILGLAGAGGALSATGPVDVDVDVVLGQGFDKATGKAVLKGEGLTLDTVSVEALGWADREVGADVDQLELAVEIEEGEATITSGVLASSLLDVELEGSVDLASELSRSRVKTELVVELDDWAGSPMESYRSVVESFLAGARWADGSYHYAIDAALGRLSFADLRPKREGGAAPTRRTTATPSTPSTGATEAPTPIPPTTSAPTAPTAPVRPPRPEIEPEPEPEPDGEWDDVEEGGDPDEDVEPKQEELDEY